MELNGTITENRMDLGGTITKTRTLSGALAPTGGGGSVVVTRGTGANSIIGVNSINPNTASGAEAISLGGGNQSVSDGGISIGTNNLVTGKNAIAIGSKIRTADPNTASGTCSTAIGVSCEASGTYAIAMGNQSEASGQAAIAMGWHSEATLSAAFAAGYFAKATYQMAGAIGWEPTASGSAAMAFGDHTTASGAGSLAVNQQTTAQAAASAALGYGTDATGARSLVAGSYNEADTEAADATTGQRKYAVIVGNGTADDARSNAATLDWNGNLEVAGKMTLGAAPVNNMDVATKKYVDDNSGSVTVDTALSTTSTNPVQNKVVTAAINAKYTKPSGGIPASDLASGVIPSVPSPASSAPAMDGTAAVGSSTDYARADHVHPTDTSRAAASDLATKITAPSSPAAGAFLVYNGSAWVAQTLSTWQGGSF